MQNTNKIRISTSSVMLPASALFSTDRILILDTCGCIRSASENGLLVKVLDGVSLLAGTDWLDCWRPEDRVSAHRALQDAYTSERGRCCARWNTPDGLMHWWDVLLHVHHTADDDRIFVVMHELHREPAPKTLNLPGSIPGTLLGMLWTATPDGRLDSVGAGWAKSRGRPAASAFGMRWLEVIHPNDRDRVRLHWRRVLDTGEPYCEKFRSRMSDGTYRWQLVRAEALRDEDQHIVGWVGVNVDIDEQQSTVEQQEIFLSLAEHSTEFIGIHDEQGDMLYINEAGSKLLEAGSVEDAKKIKFIDYVFPADRERYLSHILPALENNGRWSGSLRFKNFFRGTAMPVAFNAFQLKNSRGETTGIATICRDVRDRERFEQGLRTLAHSSSAFFDNLNPQQTLRNIAVAVTDSFATFCVIDICNEDMEFERIAFSHRDPEREKMPDFQNPSLPNLPRTHFIKRAIFDGVASVAIVDEQWIADAAITEDRAEHLRNLGFDSVLCVPIPGPDGSILGALSCGLSKSDSDRYYDSDDLVFAEELGRRAGSAISNARRYEREQRIALTFQEAALPMDLPDILGLHLSAEYRPGKTESTIGGDWYDSFLLPDGRMAIVVGDVLGNGLRAAVVMSKLRQAMQTAAYITADPNFILDAGDRMLRLYSGDMYATAMVAICDPLRGMTIIASAGHPGPALVSADGTSRQYFCPGMMLGLRAHGAERTTIAIPTACGSMLVFYTDGIIELTRDLEEGQKRFEAALGQREILASEHPARAIVDKVLREQQAEDDLAVLALRIDGLLTSDGFELYYHDVALATDARHLFAEFLSRGAVQQADLVSAELIFGELLSNVSRHAPGPVSIKVRWSQGEAVLEMYDFGPGYEIDKVCLPSESSESKRGLFLIHMFGKDLRVERCGEMTRTSVILPVRARELFVL